MPSQRDQPPTPQASSAQAGAGASAARDIVTAHAIVRWLERVMKVHVAALRLAAKRAGIKAMVDGALLQFIQDNTDVDVAAVKARLGSGEVRMAIALGARSYPMAGAVLVIKGGCVVTVKPASRSARPQRYGKAINRRTPSRRDRRSFLDAAE